MNLQNRKLILASLLAILAGIVAYAALTQFSSTGQIPQASQGFSFDFYDSKNLSCIGYEKLIGPDGKSLAFQTSAPRKLAPLEQGYDLGLRNKFGTDSERYAFTVLMEQPDRSLANASGTITGNQTSSVNIPRDFVGFKAVEGIYRVAFKIRDTTIACDAFRLTR